ncbi:MAG TPA: formimidoylglutamate deiminase [Azospirillaceae bacterium]|nr:formimidoylglutamate deiminase [Azospirillaceae bacterium]
MDRAAGDRILFAERALLPGGWADNVRVTIGGDGAIRGVAVNAARDGAEDAGGILLPGMPNVHSHAFQRAMAGLAERGSEQGDSFWTWRQVMYDFLAVLSPEQVRDIAAQLYVECLKAGYTSIAEFHYLHNDTDGRPYADPATLSQAILEAQGETGIGLAHIPVLYMRGGFDDRPLKGGQTRFATTPDGVAKLLSDLKPGPDVRLGAAIHSLRAVGEGPMRELLAALDGIDPTCPIHIHAAEQPLEVEDSLAATGRRPVEWILDEMPVDGRWVFIHATHMTDAETKRLAASGAVAGLCPTTEGNLGDGFFNLETYLRAGGRFGIGTDSHVSIDPREELRWLDYGQRLRTGKRSVDLGEAHVGARLWRAALAGGAQALGRDCGRIEEGVRADLVVLDPDHPSLYGRDGHMILDALVFTSHGNPVRHAMVGGKWQVRDGRHPAEERVAARYRRTLSQLLNR